MTHGPVIRDTRDIPRTPGDHVPLSVWVLWREVMLIRIGQENLLNESSLSSHPEKFKSNYFVRESVPLHKSLIKMERKYPEKTLNIEQN